MNTLNFTVPKFSKEMMQHITKYLEENVELPARIEFKATEDSLVNINVMYDLTNAITFHRGGQIDVTNGVTAHATTGVFGSQILPFLSCERRILEPKAIIHIHPFAYKSEISKANLHRWIDSLPCGVYFTSDRYEEMSRVLGESHKRLEDADTHMLMRLVSETKMTPEMLTDELFNQGIILTAEQALEYEIATEIANVQS